MSDVLALLANRVFGYRKNIILNNLRNSFPEKTSREILEIADAFYLNLTDILVETIKCLTIAPEELKKKVKLNNLHVLEDHLKRGSSVITMTSHQGNWEWLLLSNSLEIKNGDVIAAFQQVKNLADLMKTIRSRFGAKLIERKNILREMVKKDPRPKVFALVADQTPVGLNNRFFTRFLNQETAFYSGAEKVAIKYKMVVLYVYMRRIKRGYYEVDFIEIGQPPYCGPEFEITKAYVKNIEKSIRAYPPQWLWSHKRWKYNTKQNENN